MRGRRRGRETVCVNDVRNRASHTKKVAPANTAAATAAAAVIV